MSFTTNLLVFVLLSQLMAHSSGDPGPGFGKWFKKRFKLVEVTSESPTTEAATEPPTTESPNTEASIHKLLSEMITHSNGHIGPKFGSWFKKRFKIIEITTESAATEATTELSVIKLLSDRWSSNWSSFKVNAAKKILS